MTAGNVTYGANTRRWGTILAMAAGLAATLGASSARATDGVWLTTAGGNWSYTTKWTSGTVAGGAGSTATFNTNIFGGGNTVTINGTAPTTVTVGKLNLGDTNSSGYWTIAASLGNNLTFD